MPIDDTQADAIARVILQPDATHVAERERRKTLRLRAEAERRRVAWCMLAGMAIGALVALAAEVSFAEGALWGGLAGAAIGWLLALRRRR